MDVADFLRFSFPVLTIVLILAELLHGWRRGRRVYDARETAASVFLGLGNRILNGLLGGIAALPLVWAYRASPLRMPMDDPWTWFALFLGLEFFYYFHHYAMHRVRWLWATHLVHHSTALFNLSAGVRLGWGGMLLGGTLFYLPLALLGFPPIAIGLMFALNLAYQFFLHLSSAPRLGPLEWVFNTPTHHRVHHASNDTCLDRNFGGVLIVFDRLFGTFGEAPGGEPLRFGLKEGGVEAHRPLAVLMHGWRLIWTEWRRARSWGGRWRALFGAP